MKRAAIRIAVIEDNPLIREGWVITLKGATGVRVTGVHATCEAAFADPKFRDSDVALVDIGLPGGMSGIEGIRRMKTEFPAIAAVICTIYEDDDKVFDALCAGAIGYLLKDTPPEELVQAMRNAAGGGSPMAPSIARKVIGRFQAAHQRSAPAPSDLSDGERTVLQLLAQGKTYAEIGQDLFLSIDGVGSRIRKIYEKLQTHSRSEAVAKGIAHRLIHPF